MESHGNRLRSTSRMLKTTRDRIGVRAALDGEEALPRAVQVRKLGQAHAEANYVATRTSYGTRSAGARQGCGGPEPGRRQSAQTQPSDGTAEGGGPVGVRSSWHYSVDWGFDQQRQALAPGEDGARDVAAVERNRGRGRRSGKDGRAGRLHCATAHGRQATVAHPARRSARRRTLVAES